MGLLVGPLAVHVVVGLVVVVVALAVDVMNVSRNGGGGFLSEARCGDGGTFFALNVGGTSDGLGNDGLGDDGGSSGEDGSGGEELRFCEHDDDMRDEKE